MMTFDLGKSSCHIRPFCSDTLSYDGGCCISNSVTRHVTQTLSSDGKRMGCQRQRTQGGHNHRRHDLRSAHCHSFNSYRRTDSEDSSHTEYLRKERAGWPTRAILSDFTTRNQSSRHVLTNSARIVPKAAPATPRSAPGTVMLSPRIL